MNFESLTSDRVSKRPWLLTSRSVVRRAVMLVAIGLMPLAAARVASAAAIPYPNSGTYNSATYSFTATQTGDVVGYFVGTDAYYDSQLGLFDNGVATSAGTGLDNHASTVGQSFDFGHVTAGDSLVFYLNNSSLGQSVYSDPARNVLYDTAGETVGHDHVYSTSYLASSGMFPNVPSGTYLAFEDEQIPGANYNYADENFVLTNVSINAVPEPVSAAMIGVGVLPFLIRRSRKVAAE